MNGNRMPSGGAPPASAAELAGLTLTNPDKLLWPEVGVTKRDYLAYLYAVAQPLLAYTRNRALTVIRYPDGIHGKSFYQKNAPVFAPPWIPRRRVGSVNAILLNDLRTLLWLGNQAALEFHVSFHEVDDPEHPLELAFDLDPSVPGFSAVVETAFRLKEETDRLGLPTYVKTSGATGLAVYIPLQRRYTYAETRQVAAFLAHYLAERYPRLVTVERRVRDRGTKVYVDYLQHGPSRTLPAPYSPRGRTRAMVSAPVTWEELARGAQPADFTIQTVPARLRQMGDLFAPVTAAAGRAALDAILDFLRRHPVDR
ncbi:MAG: non-homologous end-joining DNA ligase [Bacillota bacterium]